MNDKLREALETIRSIAEWMNVSVQCVQNHPEEPPDYASEFDYKMVQASSELFNAIEIFDAQALAASKQEPQLLQKSFDELAAERRASKTEPQAQEGEPEVVEKVCYSWNDEEYNCDSFGDLLDSADDPKVGDTYYEADCVTLEPTAGINSWTVDSLLEGMDERIYEDIGECYDNECSGVSDEARAELRALIEVWAQKHINLFRYWKIVGKPREMKLTEDDLK